MEAITLAEPVRTGRQLVSVVDFGSHIPDSRIDGIHHIFRGTTWEFDDGGWVVDGSWSVLFGFDDGSFGVTQTDHIDAALEALGKTRGTPTSVGAADPQGITQAHRDDIARISAKIGEQAMRRGWCGEYETVLRDINRRMTVPMTDRHGQPVAPRH